MEDRKGLLLKRKDFLGVDEEAGSHPNRTYYFKKDSNLDNVIESCNKQLEANSLDKSALALRGSTYQKKQQYNDAIRDFSTLLQIDATNVDILYNRGIIFSKLGMQELAIEDFSKVLNIFPDHINAAFARAACYNAVGQFSRAIEDYNFALLRDQEENRNDRSDRRRSNSHGASGSPTYHEVGGPIETRSSTDSPNPLSYNPSELGYSSDHRMEGSRHLSPTPAVLRGRSPAKEAVRGGVRSSSAPPLRSAAMPPSRSSGDLSNPNTEDETGDRTPLRVSANSVSVPARTQTAEDTQLCEMYHARGFEYRQTGTFDLAIREYTKALAINPRHFKSLFNRAYALDKIGKCNEAIVDYSSAILVEPNNPFVVFNRGISLDKQGRLEDAHNDYLKAVMLKPQNTDFLLNLAFSLKRLSRYREALSVYTTCLRIQPNLVKAIFNRGFCLEKVGNIDAAMKEYNSALQKQPEHLLSLIRRAKLLLSRGNKENGLLSVQDFTLAIKLWMETPKASLPHSDSGANDIADLYSGRSKAYEVMGDVNSSFDDISLAMKMMSDILLQDSTPSDIRDITRLRRGDLYLCKIQILKNLENYSYALEECSTAISQLEPLMASESKNREILYDGRSATDIIVSLYSHHGHCLRKLDRLTESIQDYSEIIRLLPDNIKAYNNRAFCYAKIRSYAEAIKDYSTVISIDPSNSHAYHNRGISYDKTGLRDRAIEDFAKVLELDSTEEQANGSEKDSSSVSSLNSSSAIHSRDHASSSVASNSVRNENITVSKMTRTSPRMQVSSPSGSNGNFRVSGLVERSNSRQHNFTQSVGEVSSPQRKVVNRTQDGSRVTVVRYPGAAGQDTNTGRSVSPGPKLSVNEFMFDKTRPITTTNSMDKNNVMRGHVMRSHGSPQREMHRSQSPKRTSSTPRGGTVGSSTDTKAAAPSSSVRANLNPQHTSPDKTSIYASESSTGIGFREAARLLGGATSSPAPHASGVLSDNAKSKSMAKSYVNTTGNQPFKHREIVTAKLSPSAHMRGTPSGNSTMDFNKIQLLRQSNSNKNR